MTTYKLEILDKESKRTFRSTVKAVDLNHLRKDLLLKMAVNKKKTVDQSISVSATQNGKDVFLGTLNIGKDERKLMPGDSVYANWHPASQKDKDNGWRRVSKKTGGLMTGYYYEHSVIPDRSNMRATRYVAAEDINAIRRYVIVREIEGTTKDGVFLIYDKDKRYLGSIMPTKVGGRNARFYWKANGSAKREINGDTGRLI